MSVLGHILGNASLRIKAKFLGITFKECHELTTSSVRSCFCHHIFPQTRRSSQVTVAAAPQAGLWTVKDILLWKFSNAFPCVSSSLGVIFEYLFKSCWNFVHCRAKGTRQGVLSALCHLRRHTAGTCHASDYSGPGHSSGDSHVLPS